jgi:hypothetical protein
VTAVIGVPDVHQRFQNLESAASVRVVRGQPHIFNNCAQTSPLHAPIVVGGRHALLQSLWGFFFQLLSFRQWRNRCCCCVDAIHSRPLLESFLTRAFTFCYVLLISSLPHLSEAPVPLIATSWCSVCSRAARTSALESRVTTRSYNHWSRMTTRSKRRTQE